MTERITVSCPDGTKDRLCALAHENNMTLSKFMTKTRVNVDDDIYELMTKAVEKGDYKNVSALVRIAVVELIGGDQ